MYKDSTWARRPWLVNLIGCLLLMAVAGDASVLLGQDANYDLRNYHWYIAYAFQEGRMGFDIAPAQLQTFHNPLLDVPYYWIATSVPEYPAYAAFLQGTYYGLLVFFLIKCALLLLPASVGSRPPSVKLIEESNALSLVVRLPVRGLMILIALIVGASGVALVSQIGTTMGEVPVAALVMAGLYCMLVSIGTAARPVRWIMLSGCLIGAAAGLKLTAATYGVGAAVALGVTGYRQGWPKKWLALFMLALLAGFLVFQGHWMLKLYIDFGNPLFPYFNHIFASDWWEQAPLETSRFLPHDIWQWLFYPFYWLELHHYLVMEAPFRDPRVATTLLALVVLAFGLNKHAEASAREKDMWWLLITFITVSYVVWLALFSIYRYLIPVEAMSGLALAGAFRWLGSKRISALVILGFGIIAWTIYPDWGHVEFSRGVVAAEAPKIPSSSMVMLMGDAPASYVIPSFPKGVRFIGIGNSLIRPGMENRLQQQADKAIQAHRGDFFFIEKAIADKAKNDGYLAFYSLQRGECAFLVTTLQPEGLNFCSARQISE
jgi:hypothetical protein